MTVERNRPEAPDAQRCPVKGQRRNDRIGARPIFETRIEHGRALVNAPPHAHGDALDHLYQMLIVPEACIRSRENALAFDVYFLRPVDKNVAHGRISQEAFQRPQAENLVHHVGEQLLPCGCGQGALLLIQQLIHPMGAFPVKLLHRKPTGFRQVQTLDQLMMDSGFDFLDVHRGLACWGCRPVLEEIGITERARGFCRVHAGLRLAAAGSRAAKSSLARCCRSLRSTDLGAASESGSP